MMKNIIYLLFLTLSIIGCNTPDFELNSNVDEHFFLEHNDAIMPIHIRGNSASKSFCIMLHGGPGDSGIQGFYETKMFDKIEEEVAVVYYDQRCAGLSQGNCDPEALEVSMFVEDLDKLIELLRIKYGEDISLFLLGHSWGATLALDYLVNGENKGFLNGCIQSNGSHNIPLLSEVQQKYLLSYSEEQISLDNSALVWQEIRDNIIDLDPTEFWDRLDILSECYKTLAPLLEANIVASAETRVENILGYFGDYLIASHNSLINDNQPFYTKLVEYDITKDLDEITTPISLLWGRHDIVHPPDMAIDIFENIDHAEKELYFFERSHHAPMAHENVLFQEKAIEFILKHK